MLTPNLFQNDIQQPRKNKPQGIFGLTIMIKKLSLGLMSFILVLLTHNVTFADDIDIYREATESNNDNDTVLTFLLDNSGSMGWDIDSTSSNNQPMLQSQRMWIMKNAVVDLIAGLVGSSKIALYEYDYINDTSGTGRQIAAARRLDEETSAGGGGGGGGGSSVEVAIDRNDDDVTQAYGRQIRGVDPRVIHRGRQSTGNAMKNQSGSETVVFKDVNNVTAIYAATAIRLTVHSAYNGILTNRAALAELNVLDENGEVIPRDTWSISASNQGAVHRVGHMIDGDSGSYWSTMFAACIFGIFCDFPFTVDIDFGSEEEISGIIYTPKPRNVLDFGTAGRVEEFDISVINYDDELNPGNVYESALVEEGSFGPYHSTQYKCLESLIICIVSVTEATRVSGATNDRTINFPANSDDIVALTLKSFASIEEETVERCYGRWEGWFWRVRCEDFLTQKDSDRASIAKFRVKDGNNNYMNSATWDIMADSTEGGSSVNNAMDNNSNTQWTSNNNGLEHEYRTFFRAKKEITSFKYRPPSNLRGAITDYGLFKEVPNNSRIGLRFRNVQVPKGASLNGTGNGATITFTTAFNDSFVSNVSAAIDLTSAPIDFLTEGLWPATVTQRNMYPSADISNITSSGTFSAWSAGGNVTLDVSRLIQERLNSSTVTTCTLGDVVVIIDATHEVAQKLLKAYESGATTAAKLNINYAAGGSGSDACDSATNAVSTMNSDVYEEIDAGGASNTYYGEENDSPGGNNIALTGGFVGLRFNLVTLADFDADASTGANKTQISNATLNLKVKGGLAPATMKIYAINQGLAKTFSGGDGTAGVSGLSFVDGFVEWTVPPANWVTGGWVTSPNIASLMQQVIDRKDWEFEGSIAFAIEVQSTASASPPLIGAFNSATGTTIASFADDAAELKYDFTTPISNVGKESVRRDLIDKIWSRVASGGTPLAAAYVETAAYMVGENAAGTHTDSTSPTDQTEGFCSKDALVVLTDGDDPTNVNSHYADANAIISSSTCSSKWGCAQDVAESLWSSTHNGKMKTPDSEATTPAEAVNISTYAIAFGPVTGLTDFYGLAEDDDHRKTAKDGAALAEAFKFFENATIAEGGSIAAPGVAVNSFNRFQHSDELYYSSFKPSTGVVWPGNLKRYRLKVYADSSYDPLVVDRTGSPAVDETTGFFASTAKSWWSDLVDGSNVEKGGAVGELAKKYNTVSKRKARKLYTYTSSTSPSDTQVNVAANLLHEKNTAITKAMLGISAASDEKRCLALKWGRGFIGLDDTADYCDNNTDDYYEDDSVTTASDATPLTYTYDPHMRSPVHFTPLLVNYGIDRSGNNPKAENTLFLGTNEGFLHAINPRNGKEVFSFVPQQLLPNIVKSKEGTKTTGEDYLYGLDASWIALRHDVDGDGDIESADGDYINLYGGMRRGGGVYYALDVTHAGAHVRSADFNLKYKFFIDKDTKTDSDGVLNGAGTVQPFSDMGQTWAKPVIEGFHTVATPGSASRTPMLVFSGGYDTAWDSIATPPSTGSIGKHIYIVNADTGQLHYKIGPDSDSDIISSLMTDSIVASPSIYKKGDKLHIYVIDISGKLFRIDLNNNLTVSTGNQVRHLGTFGTPGTLLESRRFFEPPSVAFTKTVLDNNAVGVFIGSGMRPDLDDESVQDRVIFITDTEPYGTNIVSGATPKVLTVSDLLDVSEDPNPEESDFAASGALTVHGWYIDFDTKYEKMAGRPSFFDGKIIFTSYLRATASADGGCSVVPGQSRLWYIFAKSGAPTNNSYGEAGNTGVIEDRYTDHAKGFADGATVLLTKGGGAVAVVGVEAFDLDYASEGRLVKTLWKSKISEDN